MYWSLSLRKWVDNPDMPVVVFVCLQTWLLAASASGDNHVVHVNPGGNLTLPCGPSDPSGPSDNQQIPDFHETAPYSLEKVSPQPEVEWILPGRSNTSGSLIREKSGALYIVNISAESEGPYICSKQSKQYTVLVKLTKVPERVLNLTVTQHSFYATVSWCMGAEERVEGFLCQYRNDTSQYNQVMASDLVYKNSSRPLGAGSRTCDIYALLPNHTYFVKVAAYNSAGRGPFVSVVFRTKPDNTRTNSTTRSIVIGLMTGCALVIFVATAAISLFLRQRKYTNLQPISPVAECSLVEESELHTPSPSTNPHITLNPAFNIEMLENLDTSENACLMGDETHSRNNH